MLYDIERTAAEIERFAVTWLEVCVYRMVDSLVCASPPRAQLWLVTIDRKGNGIVGGLLGAPRVHPRWKPLQAGGARSGKSCLLVVMPRTVEWGVYTASPAPDVLQCDRRNVGCYHGYTARQPRPDVCQETGKRAVVGEGGAFWVPTPRGSRTERCVTREPHVISDDRVTDSIHERPAVQRSAPSV